MVQGLGFGVQEVGCGVSGVILGFGVRLRNFLGGVEEPLRSNEAGGVYPKPQSI